MTLINQIDEGSGVGCCCGCDDQECEWGWMHIIEWGINIGSRVYSLTSLHHKNYEQVLIHKVFNDFLSI